jgi:predicted nucleotidyltransferase
MAETAAVDVALEKAIAFLQKRIRIEAAYLFGSQLAGNTHPDSDIDLAVFSPDVHEVYGAGSSRVGTRNGMPPGRRAAPLFFRCPC